jgi:hypothetical protein
MKSFEHFQSQIVPKQNILEHMNTPEKIVEFRNKQSYGSKLAEFIIGLRPDDSKFAERIALDQKIIRNKYLLPAFELMYQSPTEYERLLYERAAKDGVKIRDKSDCGTYFIDNPNADGAFFEEQNQIGSRVDRESKESYTESLSTIEHEFIHSQQMIKSPSMPIELKEYEAYIAGVNLNTIKDPESAEMLFSFFIGGSVDYWYRDKNKERQASEPEIKAVYKDPEYFLKNVDHLN